MVMNMKYQLLYKDFKRKAVTFSFDDGTFQDIEMVNMLNQLNLKATFNLNSALMNENGTFIIDDWLVNYRLDLKIAMKIYKNHEIAGHGLHHYDLCKLDEETLKKEILEDISNLSKSFQTKIDGFAYPYGSFNEKVIQILKQNNILYARSVQSSFNFLVPQNFYIYGGTCDISNPKLSSLIRKWNNYNSSELGLFYIWGHSYELDMFHEHEVVFDHLKMIANKEDCWYATNSEVFSYLTQAKKLTYIKKTKCLINHSNISLYLLINGKNVLLKKGEKFFIE